MSYLEFYNQPVGTIFYKKIANYGIKEYRLVRKDRLSFGELRMILKTGPASKPIYIWWDEYDTDPYFDNMRLNLLGGL